MAKADPDQLQQRLAECPQEGARFRHYKGGEYVVVGSAILEATLEPSVLYRPVAGAGSDICWARGLSDWNARVQVGAEEVSRFQRID
jgi:hypothetical protein